MYVIVVISCVLVGLELSIVIVDLDTPVLVLHMYMGP